MMTSLDCFGIGLPPGEWITCFIVRTFGLSDSSRFGRVGASRRCFFGGLASNFGLSSAKGVFRFKFGIVGTWDTKISIYVHKKSVPLELLGLICTGGGGGNLVGEGADGGPNSAFAAVGRRIIVGNGLGGTLGVLSVRGLICGIKAWTLLGVAEAPPGVEGGVCGGVGWSYIIGRRREFLGA